MFNRRKFLNAASLLVASGLIPKRGWAMGNNYGPEIKKNAFPPLPEATGNEMASIIETKIICKEPGRFIGVGSEFGLDMNGHSVVKKKVVEQDRYIGWPTIAKTKDGELLVVFSGDRDGHVCPWGKTQMIRSSDNGKSWSDPETINNTQLDDRDAGLIQTNKGTLLVSWFTSLAFTLPAYPAEYLRYARIAEKIPAETRKQWLGNWMRRSEDGGKTWLSPSRTTATAPHGAIQLRDGRQMIIGPGEWEGKTAILAEVSEDDGRTWHVLSVIPKPEGNTDAIGEPHLVQLSSGKIIAMFRHEPKDQSQCFLLQSESTDNGKTWSTMHNTGIWGYPPHLIQLNNNWLLVVYGYRKEPFSERACISRDEGKTWDTKNEIILTYAASRDLGYPSSVQLNDGSILTVYYQAPNAGDPSCLMSTRWMAG